MRPLPLLKLVVLTAAFAWAFSALASLATALNVPDHWNMLSGEERVSIVNAFLALGVLYLTVRVLRYSSHVVATQHVAAPRAGVERLAQKDAVGYSKQRVTTQVPAGETHGIDVQTRVRVHEAGHAAVALHLGFTLREVSATPDEISGGRVAIQSHPAGNRSNEAFWSKAVMASAGVEAELKLLGHAEASGGAGDLNEVQALCNALAGVEYQPTGVPLTAQELVSEAKRQARAAVERHEVHIEAIADHLKQQPRLTGRQAAELFDLVDQGQAA